MPIFKEGNKGRMKLICFAVDYVSNLNLPPMFGLPSGLKKGEIRYPKGHIMKVTDEMAKRFCKRTLVWDEKDRCRQLHRPAYVMRDLGCAHYPICRDNPKRKVRT